MSAKRKLNIGTVDSLFENCEFDDGFNDAINNAYEKVKNKVEKSELYDDCDDILNETYDKIRNKFEYNKGILDDDCDDMLNESYERVKDKVENKTESLDDNNDHFLNEAYDRAKHQVEKRTPIPKNMLHLVRRSPKEIKRNHMLAKIRLIETKCTWSQRFKSEMNEYFHCIESWPTYVLEILLSKFFSYHERIGLACFMHGNGMTDKDKALRIFQFYNKHWRHDRDWYNRFFKFQNLFPYLDQTKDRTDAGDRLRNEYYYYDMNLNLTMYYDGNVRTKNGDKRRYYSLFEFRRDRKL